MSDHSDIIKSFNPQEWMKYLGRGLSQKEFHLMASAGSINHGNEVMKEILLKFKDDKIYYPVLTDLDGNCMFRSLNYHGIGTSSNDLRQLVTYILYQFKEFQGFLPNFKEMNLETLYSMFTELDDMKYVLDVDKFKVYKYNYDVMCQELATNGSWNYFNSHFLLLIISRLFKVDIIIYHSSGIMRACAWENYDGDIPILRKIYLALLGENHYIPVDIFPEEKDPTEIEEYYANPNVYEKELDSFKSWASNMVEEKIKSLEFISLHHEKKITSDVSNDHKEDNNETVANQKESIIIGKDEIDKSNNIIMDNSSKN